jgi:hypothetical protein
MLRPAHPKPNTAASNTSSHISHPDDRMEVDRPEQRTNRNSNSNNIELGTRRESLVIPNTLPSTTTPASVSNNDTRIKVEASSQSSQAIPTGPRSLRTPLFQQSSQSLPPAAQAVSSDHHSPPRPPSSWIPPPPHFNAVPTPIPATSSTAAPVPHPSLPIRPLQSYVSPVVAKRVVPPPVIVVPMPSSAPPPALIPTPAVAPVVKRPAAVIRKATPPITPRPLSPEEEEDVKPRIREESVAAEVDQLAEISPEPAIIRNPVEFALQINSSYCDTAKAKLVVERFINE